MTQSKKAKRPAKKKQTNEKKNTHNVKNKSEDQDKFELSPAGNVDGKEHIKERSIVSSIVSLFKLIILWLYQLLVVGSYHLIIVKPWKLIKQALSWFCGFWTLKGQSTFKHENGHIGTNYEEIKGLSKNDGDYLNKYVKEEGGDKPNLNGGAMAVNKKNRSSNKKNNRGKKKLQGKNIQHNIPEISQLKPEENTDKLAATKLQQTDKELENERKKNRDRFVDLESILKDKNDLLKRLKLSDDTISQLKRKNEEVDNRLDEAEQRMITLKQEKDNALNRLDEAEQRMITLKQEKDNALNSFKKNKIELEKEKKQKGKGLNELMSVQNERDGYLKRLREAEQRMKTLKQEKDDALNRLSELMGEKLRDNNPAITNLNDPNRPMKLAEQFSELYENEWTDVFTDLDSESIPELEIISTLLELLKEILRACETEVNERIMELSQGENSNNVLKIKDFLKSQAAQNLQPLKMKIINDEKCPVVKTYSNRFASYIEKCMNICYYAELQTPPMYISFDAGTTFDKQCFKEYTKSGTYVDYLVWPAMYLHKDGPLMAKGVLQPHENSTDC